MTQQDNLIEPTAWPDNPYRPEWAEQDYLHTPDGTGPYPKHACKMPYLLSKPFTRNFRNAVDVGCRVGEFTRYLHLDFAHVYGFDPNLWKPFRFNVDLSRVTHYNCAIGDRRETITMYGGMHTEQPNARVRDVPAYPLDDFGLRDVDYIKIDVEGFEKKVLQGAARTIDASDPVIVIEQNHVVLHDDVQFSAKEYCESIGYREVAVDARGWDFVMARS